MVCFNEVNLRMAIHDDIDRQLNDWINFDDMLADVAKANQVDVPRLQYWLHMKKFCYLRPFRFWHPHVEYQQDYKKARNRAFVEGTILVEFLLGADCFPDETTLWAFQNGGVALWQKSVVSEWLRAREASVPDHWLVTEEPTRPVCLPVVLVISQAIAARSRSGMRHSRHP